MKTFHDYESMGSVQNIEEAQVPVLEVLSGSQVVSWYTMIDDFLQRKLDDQEAARNHENADRLRAFLNTWRDNELTGSISVDQLLPLKAAAEQAAAVKSPLRPIFTSILRNLRKLIADEEQLPRGIDQNAVNPMGGGGLGSAPPMSPDFGPEEQAPPGMEGGEGNEADLAAGMEQPGEEGKEDELMAAAEMASLDGAPEPGMLAEDQASDIGLFRTATEEFQSETGKPLDGNSMQDFKTWLKRQLRMSVRARVMCVVLFKQMFVRGRDEAGAWQLWIQREPEYRQDFEVGIQNDPRWRGVTLTWDGGRK